MFKRRPAIGTMIYFGITLLLAINFGFAAVQGDYGLFRRVELISEADQLRQTLTQLQGELGEITNLTRRMSDQYLDLDLLDERARDMLGQIRPDEIVIR